MKEKVIYINPPECCDLCGKVDLDIFYDGATLSGVWANMCIYCYGSYGKGPDYVTSYVKTDQGYVSTKERS